MALFGKIAAACFAVALLAVTAAWAVPPLLDWGRYRDVIATLATEKVGRPVRIAGPVSLELLPEPTLTAARISVDPGPDGIALSVRVVRLRVALGPLLAGRIEARDVVLRGLDARLPDTIEPAGLSLRAPDWLRAISAHVEDGQLTVGRLVVTDIDAALATGALTGSYQAAGTAFLSGRPWRFTARLMRPGGDGSAGIDVTLDGQGPAQDTGMALTGQIASDGNFAGRVIARGADLGQLLPAPHVPFHADGRVTVAAGLAAADDLAVQIGTSPARAAVALRLTPKPRLDIALATSRLDLDAWLPALEHTGSPLLPLGVDLSAEAADLGGGTLRQIRGAFDLGADVTELRELHATLPGEAQLNMSGRIDRRDAAHPRFVGDAHLVAPALRTTLSWMASAGLTPLASLPPGVLRTGDLAGHVGVAGAEVTIDALEGRIDQSAIHGTLAARLGGRLALSAGLRVDRIDFDPWLPHGWPTQSALADALTPLDLDLRLDAARAMLGGREVSGLVLDTAAQGGRVTLRHLAFAAADLHVAASGTLVEGGRLADAHLDLQAQTASALVPLLPDPLARWDGGGTALLRAPLKLQLTGAGPPEAIDLRLLATLGDLRIEGEPRLDLVHRRWNGRLTLRHPGAPRLAEQAGLPSAAAWLGDGSLAIVATVAGGGDTLTAESFDLTAAALHATGQLTLDLTGPPALAGRINAETLPLPLPYPRSPDPLPIAILRGWSADLGVQVGQVLIDGAPLLRGVATRLTLHDGQLGVVGLTANLDGGKLAASASFDAAAEPPRLALTATTANTTIATPVFETGLDLDGGALDGSVRLDAAGFAPATLLATLHGDVHLAVRNAVVAGLDLTSLAATGDQAALSDDAVRHALAGGTTAFAAASLDGHVAGGLLIIDDSHLEGADGSGRLAGTIDLPAAGADLDLNIALPRPDAPTIGLRLTGPVDALRRTAAVSDLVRWRAAREARGAQLTPASATPSLQTP